MSAAPDVMTLRQAAAYLQVHPRTLSDWCREGVVPVGKLGRVYRFRKAALDQWLAEKEQARQAVLPGTR